MNNENARLKYFYENYKKNPGKVTDGLEEELQTIAEMTDANKCAAAELNARFRRDEKGVMEQMLPTLEEMTKRRP